MLAQGVLERQLYKVAAEIKFDGTNPIHTRLERLDNRHQAEEGLAQLLGIPPQHILIDIPERISFESDLWICDEEVPFSQSSTVFSSQTVASFTGSLRKIRVAIRQQEKSCSLQDKEFKIIARFLDMEYNSDDTILP